MQRWISTITFVLMLALWVAQNLAEIWGLVRDGWSIICDVWEDMKASVRLSAAAPSTIYSIVMKGQTINDFTDLMTRLMALTKTVPKFRGQEKVGSLRPTQVRTTADS